MTTTITWEFIALLLSIAGNIVLLIRKNTISPQPLGVRLSDQYVTQKECSNVHEQTALRVTAMEHSLGELKVERREDVNALHDKINDIAREVSELKATSALELAQLNRIDEKLAELQSR